MTTKRFNLTHLKCDVFYKIIYPLYAREFLFGDNYEEFASLVEQSFLLNETQWENILREWEFKEDLL